MPSKTWSVIVQVILQQGLHQQLDSIMMLATISVLTELSQCFFHGLMSIQDKIIKKYLLVKIMVRHVQILILLKGFGLIMILTIILNRRQTQQMVRVMKTT